MARKGTRKVNGKDWAMYESQDTRKFTYYKLMVYEPMLIEITVCFDIREDVLDWNFTILTDSDMRELVPTVGGFPSKEAAMAAAGYALKGIATSFSEAVYAFADG